MKFIALSHKDIEVELIRIALREHGECEFVNDEEMLLKKLIDSKSSKERYSAVFIYPGKEVVDGFTILKKIRETENLHDEKIHIIFLCENKNVMYLMDTISKDTESYVSKNIIKREILETLISKKIIK
ncbi:MAG: hypothetical protein ACK5LT_02975 [Lachnospirales bacterium]